MTWAIDLKLKLHRIQNRLEVSLLRWLKALLPVSGVAVMLLTRRGLQAWRDRTLS